MKPSNHAQSHTPHHAPSADFTARLHAISDLPQHHRTHGRGAVFMFAASLGVGLMLIAATSEYRAPESSLALLSDEYEALHVATYGDLADAADMDIAALMESL